MKNQVMIRRHINTHIGPPSSNKNKAEMGKDVIEKNERKDGNECHLEKTMSAISLAMSDCSSAPGGIPAAPLASVAM